VKARSDVRHRIWLKKTSLQQNEENEEKEWGTKQIGCSAKYKKKSGGPRGYKSKNWGGPES